ncbi:MAG: hypothetical protein LBR26_13140 [Prevotella sp.]|jgi:hypothetical protein|nr:hypothetical protein [Prevotella sp.]
MEKNSVEKLLKAGYVFLRADDGGWNKERKYRIRYSDCFGTWKVLEKFPTKAARDRRIKELMEEDKYLY